MLVSYLVCAKFVRNQIHMKKFGLFVFSACISFFSCAQDKNVNTSVIGLHTGSALAGSLYLSQDNWSPEVDKTSVTQITFDHMLRKGFSIGATAAYQSAELKLVDTLTEIGIEDGRVNRIYVGVRTLWHYGKNERWDLYSGVKFGMILFVPTNISKSHQGESIIEENHTRSSPRVGVIPIGFRYYLTDEIALGAQMSVGVPTLATFNFNYAF